VTARDSSQAGTWRCQGIRHVRPHRPFIETEIDPSSLKLQTKVNGVVKQSSNTANLIFNVPYLVSYLSHVMTLLPGDIISTGKPSGISRLEHGMSLK
jgi:2-keto-4-pentenoate hydratase/2-oxohepta-3-ene-1,7-dioic acid hydratase in catechol pathway